MNTWKTVQFPPAFQILRLLKVSRMSKQMGLMNKRVSSFSLPIHHNCGLSCMFRTLQINTQVAKSPQTRHSGQLLYSWAVDRLRLFKSTRTLQG